MRIVIILVPSTWPINHINVCDTVYFTVHFCNQILFCLITLMRSTLNYISDEARHLFLTAASQTEPNCQTLFDD